MKIPVPDHPITVNPHSCPVRITFAGVVLAESKRAIALKEGNYPTVLYIPREDVRMERFERSANATHCPYKGDASYYSAVVNGKRSDNAAWSYENPFPHMAEIKEYFAFYPNRIDTIEDVL